MIMTFIGKQVVGYHKLMIYIFALGLFPQKDITHA